MLDRQRLEAILTYRFPAATLKEIAAAANAIMALSAADAHEPVRRPDAGLQRVAGSEIETMVPPPVRSSIPI